MITAQEIGQMPLFADLSQEQLEVLAGLAEEKNFAEGEYLFKEGDSATHIFILLEGKIGIQVRLTSRPDSYTYTVLSQFGQMVGWSGLVAPSHYTAAAVSQMDSRLMAMDGQALMRAFEADCHLGFTVMRRVTEVIGGRMRNIQRVVFKTL
jgi:CRP-like cAMP-binding protein